MILKIGNKSPLAKKSLHNNGFSLFEVMVTVIILSVGITGVYQAFFMSLNHLNYLTARCYAQILLDNKVTELQAKFKSDGVIDLEKGMDGDEIPFDQGALRYGYTANFRNVGNLDDLLELNVNCLWNDGRRDFKLSKAAYILKY